MSLWGTLFGSENVIKKAADGIYNGVDAAVYTNQEKATGFLNLLKAYEPFKLAQRLLALTVVIPYVVIWILSAGMLVASGFLAEPDALVEAAKALGTMNNQNLGTPVALILAFYFGGGALEGVVGRFKSKPG